jgi:hypothetical protein
LATTWVNVTNEPLASLDVERIVTRGGAVKDVFPLESTKEMKLGEASVDSGASVIVLVVVPVNDVKGPLAGADARLVGLAGAAFVDPGFAPDFTTASDRVF